MRRFLLGAVVLGAFAACDGEVLLATLPSEPGPVADGGALPGEAGPPPPVSSPPPPPPPPLVPPPPPPPPPADAGVDACDAASCASETLASGLSSPVWLTLDNVDLFWGEGGGLLTDAKPVRAMTKTGGTPRTVSTGLPGRLHGLVVDGTSAYWLASPSSGALTVARVPKDGTAPAPQDVVDVSGIPGALTSDGTLLYYAASTKLDVTTKTGTSNPEQQLATTLANQTVNGMTFVSGFVYAVEGNGTLDQIALPGGQNTPLPSIPAGSTSLAANSTHVFYASGATIGRVARSGATLAESLAAGLDGARWLTIDGARVYYTTRTTVESVPLAGGAVTTHVTGLVEAGSITNDVDHVYFVDTGGVVGGGIIYRISK